MTEPSIRIATPADRASVIDTVVAAFDQDPAFRWFFPTDASWSRNAQLFAGALFDSRVESQATWLVDNAAAVAMWADPAAESLRADLGALDDDQIGTVLDLAAPVVTKTAAAGLDALGALLDEGLGNSFARHQMVGDALQAGLVERGFQLFAAEGNRLPQLTSVWVPEEKLPEGMTEADVRRTLLFDYGVEIGGGLGELAGKGWRIGLMGHTARMRNVTVLLAALDDILV